MLISEVPPWGLRGCPEGSFGKEAAVSWSHCQGQCVLSWQGSLGSTFLSDVGAASICPGVRACVLCDLENRGKVKNKGTCKGCGSSGRCPTLGFHPPKTLASIRILRCPITIQIHSPPWGQCHGVLGWGYSFNQMLLLGSVLLPNWHKVMCEKKIKTVAQWHRVLEGTGAPRLGLPHSWKTPGNLNPIWKLKTGEWWTVLAWLLEARRPPALLPCPGPLEMMVWRS